MEPAKTTNAGSELQPDQQGIRVTEQRQTPCGSSTSSAGTCRNKQQTLSSLSCQSTLLDFQHSTHTSSSHRQGGRRASVGPMMHVSSPLCSKQLCERRTNRGPMSLPLCSIKGDLCDVRDMVQVSRLREAVRARARPV